MVHLYIWKPTSLETVLENGIAPDVGHAAIEVSVGTGTTYISFWPEIDSAIGRIAQLLKPRQTRHPATYAQEISPDDAFMQRPADFEVELPGLDEAVILRLWEGLADSGYDFLCWNCSNVCKFLLLSAAPRAKRAALDAAMSLCPDETNCIDSDDMPHEKLRFLATYPFIDCRPEDLKRAAEVFLAAAA